jgi:hypothetical protein
MKQHLLIASAILLSGATALFAQSIPVKVSSPTPSPAQKGATESVTGRIVHLNTRKRTFAVRAWGAKKSVELKAGNEIDVHQLRRGERVIVTYSEGTAIKVEATRATK